MFYDVQSTKHTAHVRSFHNLIIIWRRFEPKKLRMLEVGSFPLTMSWSHMTVIYGTSDISRYDDDDTWYFQSSLREKGGEAHISIVTAATCHVSHSLHYLSCSVLIDSLRRTLPET